LRIENIHTIPTDTPPMSIPRRNLFLFQGVLRRYDTPYPHRYTGRSAIQKARNDRKINDTVN